MDGPRGRIYLMRAATDRRLTLDDAARRHLDLCLDCRACESACPSGVKYHEILEPFRAAMAESRQVPPLPWLQRFVLHHVTSNRRLARWALAPLRLLQKLHLRSLAQTATRVLIPSARSLLDQLPPLERHYGQLPEHLPALGRPRARVALFLGCVADGIYPQTNLATARVLQHNGCEVWIPRRQGCCGALDYHAGQRTRSRNFMASNLAAFGFDSADGGALDAIVTNAAGCGAMLKDYGHILRHERNAAAAARLSAKVKDISEFLIDLGIVAPTHSVRLRAAYHDACHLRHGQKVIDQPRQLLQSIPGLELVPLHESDFCCGAAGSYNLTQPDMSDRLGRRKAEFIIASGADAVVTGNVGCQLQIVKHLRRLKPNLTVHHPVDLLWQAYGGGAQA